MRPPSTVVAMLRVLLALAFTVLLVAQVRALPAMYDDWSRDAPERASSGWPLLPAGLLVLACTQVVIVCTWRLLTLVEHGQIFSARSFRFVDTIVGAVAVGAVVLLALAVHLVAAGWTVLPVVVLLALIGAAVVGLLMVVMRALLRQATELRVDLDAVV